MVYAPTNNLPGLQLFFSQTVVFKYGLYMGVHTSQQITMRTGGMGHAHTKLLIIDN